MAAIVIDRFGGIAPRLDPSVLPPYGAQVAQDTRLHAGVLRGFLRPASAIPPLPVPVDTKTLFLSGTNWFTWSSYVDIVDGPVADAAAAKRYYYTGDGVPKKTDATLAVTGSGAMPRTWRHMGVPAPAAFTAAITAHVGTSTAVNVVYVATYVSEFSGIEEESAPSAPVTVAGWQDGTTADTVTFTWAAGGVVPTDHYNITKRRIYRSHGGDYLFVKEVAVGTATSTENVSVSGLMEAISTTDFDEPPANLTGLIALPNGSLAGISGNEICFSEPYQPHAWPAKYRQPVADVPVALVAAGQGCYIATQKRPAICTGVHPDSMTLEWANKAAPCVAPRSVAFDGRGFMYATYNGVAYVTGTDVAVSSLGGMTQEEWGRYAPSTMVGLFYDERYSLFYEVSAEERGALQFDQAMSDAPITHSREFTTAAYVDGSTGALYVVDDGEIKTANADLINPRTPYVWRSKLFILPNPLNFGYGQVLVDDTQEGGDSFAARLAFNEAVAASGGGDLSGAWGAIEFNEYPVNGSALLTDITDSADYVTLRIYAGGKMVSTRNILSNAPFKLLAGFKHTDWEIEVAGTMPVRRVTLATSMAEIKAR